MKSANGWSSDVGQYSDHSSYIRRPSRTVSCVPITSPRFASITSSKSSRNVSGSSATPSTDTSVYATTLRMPATSPVARARAAPIGTASIDELIADRRGLTAIVVPTAARGPC